MMAGDDMFEGDVGEDFGMFAGARAGDALRSARERRAFFLQDRVDADAGAAREAAEQHLHRAERREMLAVQRDGMRRLRPNNKTPAYVKLRDDLYGFCHACLLRKLARLGVTMLIIIRCIAKI